MAALTTYLKTSGQASYTYNFGGKNSPPKPKNLFIIRFQRAAPVASWQRELSFVVKSADRPAITPTTEELNQYNKKRQVYTGYKINPVRVSMFDTADNLAAKMWSEYANHYFGDFVNTVDKWGYDTTSDYFKGGDPGSRGFGFVPQAGDADLAQFFFSTVDIYQLFGGQYLLTTLVHPRISSFEPDDLDYGSSDPGVVSVTLNPEAVLYHNDGVPQALANDQYLVDVFGSVDANDGDIRAVGRRQETPSTTQDLSFASIPRRPEIKPTSKVSANQPLQPTIDIEMRKYRGSIGVGSFSEYNFGSVVEGGASSQDVSLLPLYGESPASATTARSASGPLFAEDTIERNTQRNLAGLPLFAASDLSARAVRSDGQMAASLQLSSNGQNDAVSNALAQPYVNKKAGISGTNYDVAVASVQAAANPNGTFDPKYYADAVVGSTLAANQVGGGSPRDQVRKVGGIELSSDAYGLMNASRKPTAQIGINPNRRR